MPQFTIRKGKHRAWPLALGIFFKKKSLQRTVRFDESARYQLGNNQLDINKLFGLRYFSGDYSARFGWRYILGPGKIELLAYVHDNGHVTKSEDERIICRIDLNKNYLLELQVTKMTYNFSVAGPDQFEAERVVSKSHRQKFSFRQGLFFGGKMPAPNEIRVRINK